MFYYFWKEQNHNDLLHIDRENPTFVTVYNPEEKTHKTERLLLDLDIYFLVHRFGKYAYYFQNESMYKLHLDTMVWDRVDVKPPFRCGAVQVDKYVYTFGGQRWKNRQYLGEGQEMLQFSLVNETGKYIDQRGDIPSARRFSTMVHSSGSIWLFGGRDRYVRFSDLYRFDINESNWTRIEGWDGEAPSPRSSQSMVIVGSSLFVWGGKSEDIQNPDEGRDGNDNTLYEYNIHFNIWKPRYCEGPIPVGVYWQSTCFVDKKMYIQGGTEDWELGPIRDELWSIYLIPSFSTRDLNHSLHHFVGSKLGNLHFEFR
jgi:hypothetical protein